MCLNCEIADGPRNVVITPRKDEYNLGDIIECAANANPPPNYRWEEVKTAGKTDGAQLKLTLVATSEQSDASQIYKCIAENLVRGERKTATAEVSVKIIKIGRKGKSDFYLQLNCVERYKVHYLNFFTNTD